MNNDITNLIKLTFIMVKLIKPNNYFSKVAIDKYYELV